MNQENIVIRNDDNAGTYFCEGGELPPLDVIMSTFEERSPTIQRIHVFIGETPTAFFIRGPGGSWLYYALTGLWLDGKRQF